MFWPNFLLLLLLFLVVVVVVLGCCCCSWLLFLVVVVVVACWCLLVLVGGACWCVQDFWASPPDRPSPDRPSPGPPFPWTALPLDRPKFRSFLPLSRRKIRSFLPLWVCSRGILVVFEAPGPSNVHVWALWLSCGTPAAPPDRAAGARTRQPENSKRAHLSVPALQTPPKFHEKTPREEEQNKFCGGRGKKKREIWAPHPSGLHPSGPHPSGPTLRGSGPHFFWVRAHTFGPPPFGAPTLRGSHPSGLPPFGPPPFGPLRPPPIFSGFGPPPLRTPTPPRPHPSAPPPLRAPTPPAPTKNKIGQMRSGQIRSTKIGQIRPK